MEWKSYHFDGPASNLLELFRDKPFVFLLESSLTDPQVGRYSFIGFDPFEVFKCPAGDRADRLKELRARFSRYAPDPAWLAGAGSLTPLPCGIFGYLSYDFGLNFEQVPRSPEKKRGAVPECLLGFYDAVITVDHLTRKLYVCSCGLPQRTLSSRKARARRRLQQIKDILEPFLENNLHPGSSRISGPSLDLKSELTLAQYSRMVRRALDYIRQGDIYQVNLSQRFFVDRKNAPQVEPVRIYRSLRDISPSHFSGYFDCGKFQIISSSPERFLSLRGRNVETRPMKGTRPRAQEKRRDEKFRQELRHSPKEKAELLMITDLERNDLGRVCDYGSVRVSRMRTLEEYKTVFQATSTIEGRLRKDKDPFDLLRACFPGGSITGCPKIRAMEIIEELEPSRRGIYTGSMGYVSFTGAMDFNILIRTLFVEPRRISFSVGGGIVADSVPQKEYAETLVKAKAMKECLKAAGPAASGVIDGRDIAVTDELIDRLAPGVMKAAGVFETMRADHGHIHFLARHLRRLEKGLQALRIPLPCPVGRLRAYSKETLSKSALKIARVRLMVWKDKRGSHFAVLVLPYEPPSAQRYKEGFFACLSSLRVPERSDARSVKAIRYQPFYAAYKQAKKKKCDEAILLNRKNDLAEGTRSNVFVVKDGALFTPDLASGCLEGITRQVVIELAGKNGVKVLEGRLKLSSLLKADEVFLTNSMIGIVPLTRFDGRPVGKGKAGPVTLKLTSAYRKNLT